MDLSGMQREPHPDSRRRRMLLVMRQESRRKLLKKRTTNAGTSTVRRAPPAGQDWPAEHRIPRRLRPRSLGARQVTARPSRLTSPGRLPGTSILRVFTEKEDGADATAHGTAISARLDSAEQDLAEIAGQRVGRLRFGSFPMALTTSTCSTTPSRPSCPAGTGWPAAAPRWTCRPWPRRPGSAAGPAAPGSASSGRPAGRPASTPVSP